MSPDDHIAFTKFERTKTSATVSYGENAIIKQVREYVAGYRDALERLADAVKHLRTDGPFDAAKATKELRAAEEHARSILEAGQ